MIRNSPHTLDHDHLGSAMRRIQFTYADSNWGQLTKIEQADTAAVGGGTPAIDYAYDDGVSGSAAAYLRRTAITYPGPGTRTIVYRNYAASGAGLVLSRLDNIAADGSGTTKYAQYSYLGAATIFKVQHPAVTNNLILNYDPSANGTYTGLDQFGQVVDQNWTVNSSTVDQYQYGYDRNGNRNYRKNTQSVTKSDYHAYDNLDRLTHTDHGTLNVGLTAITTLASAQDWTLDELGNWSTFKADNDGNGNYGSSGDLDQPPLQGVPHVRGLYSATKPPIYDFGRQHVPGTGSRRLAWMGR